MRTPILLTLTAIALGACASTGKLATPPPPSAPAPTATEVTPSTAAPPTTEPAPPTYPPFGDIDPYTSLYFVTLESTTLAEDQGPERLYNLGIGVCRNLDRGNTIDTELTGLIEDARLTAPDAGALVGAAVTDLCPHHGPTVEQYLQDENN